MKYIAAFLIVFSLSKLYGINPVYNTYEKPHEIQAEFDNVFANAQDQGFFVFKSTPNLNQLKDNQIVIVSSGTYTKLMFRRNVDIFSINVSCVTVRR